MNHQVTHRYHRAALLLVITLVALGCSDQGSPGDIPPPIVSESETEPPIPPTSSLEQPAPIPTATSSPEPVVEAAASPPESGDVSTPVPTPPPTPSPESAFSDALYSDNFEDTASGWPNEVVIGNYYIGYHEPDYFHVEVSVPNDRALASLPGLTYDDFSVQAEILVDETNTAEGDFYYGLAIRRAGNQYYAFTISPRTMSWRILKSSPTALETLQEGSDETIQGLQDLDALRVDASGSTFTFHINGRPVGQVTDPDYASGEVGLYVETLDSPRAHIHYDSLAIRELQPTEALYSDNFEDTSSGWPNEVVIGDYYIGYHEPDYFHVEVSTPNDRALASLPGLTFADFTAQAEILVDETNTEEGDFYYGLAIRRAGNHYYAFAISPHTKSWRMLKSSPTALETLQEGTDETIQGLQDLDALRVDASGSTFTFHINGRPVGQVTDPDYAIGEVGLYVETLDSPRAHIHYDSLAIREVEAPQFVCTVVAFALNLRSGPGISYSPPITTLPAGTRVVPIARSLDALWIQIKLPDSDQIGWVSAEEPFASCNFNVFDLPIP